MIVKRPSSGASRWSSLGHSSPVELDRSSSTVASIRGASRCRSRNRGLTFRAVPRGWSEDRLRAALAAGGAQVAFPLHRRFGASLLASSDGIPGHG